MSEKINCADDLRKRLGPLEQRLGYRTELNRVFGRKGTNTIISAYNMMKVQLLAVADGKAVKATDKDRNLAHRAAEVMTSMITAGMLTQYFRDLAEDYLPLLTNWNIQLGKNQIIGTLAGACQRILSDAMTMRDTTDVMNRAAKKLREQLRYKPPAFDLSRHYLKSLQEDIEKKEVAEKC